MSSAVMTIGSVGPCEHINKDISANHTVVFWQLFFQQWANVISLSDLHGPCKLIDKEALFGFIKGFHMAMRNHSSKFACTTEQLMELSTEYI